MKSQKPGFTKIFKVVKVETAIGPRLIKSDSRIGFVPSARKIFIHVAYRLGYSYQEIGREIGRDRSTIYKQLGPIDPEEGQLVNLCVSLLTPRRRHHPCRIPRGVAYV
jgi:hypothetical protein